MTRPSLNLTPAEMKARKIEQSAEAKRRRVTLKASMGGGLCRERLCIAEATDGTLCAHHSGRENQRHHAAPCVKCGGISMPDAKLCGYCQELAEEQTSKLRTENRRKHRAEQRAA